MSNIAQNPLCFLVLFSPNVSYCSLTKNIYFTYLFVHSRLLWKHGGTTLMHSWRQTRHNIFILQKEKYLRASIIIHIKHFYSHQKPEVTIKSHFSKATRDPLASNVAIAALLPHLRQNIPFELGLISSIS